VFDDCLRFPFLEQQVKLDEEFGLRHDWPDSAVGVATSCAHVRLSKNVDYLIDNLFVVILS